MPNRLSQESSPYLLQHAHNPVDWYPWAEEALTRALRENTPIFLSVGYSTCYWCHVMERECFENPTIAQQMNRSFINIKVDREERPDVDQLYMTAVQIITRQGGWPMSVFLTPDLRPFYGGTYFPPTDHYGRPGFPKVLSAVRAAFDNQPQDVESSAQQITSLLNQLARPRPPSKSFTITRGWLKDLIERSAGDFDEQHGGFGSAPKFPRETLLELLLVYLRDNPDRELTRILTRSLDAMAYGGIRDHLGGGFHRYSTDAHWLVPHFEIMLYDNAMLLWIYTEAHRQGLAGNRTVGSLSPSPGTPSSPSPCTQGEGRGEGSSHFQGQTQSHSDARQPGAAPNPHIPDSRYATIARAIADFLLREMTSPDGAFFTALDAEVDGKEGANYLWTRAEIESALAGKTDVAKFLHVYGLDAGPNLADPHHGTGVPDQNVLFLAEPDDGATLTDPDLEESRQILYAIRKQRKQPRLDNKILTSWNALTIRALAHAAETLNEPRYLDAARKAADFLLRTHRDQNGNLLRTSAGSTAKHPAFLDDYAFLAQALLRLPDNQYHAHAIDLARAMKQRFSADPGGFFYTDQNANDLFVRQMVASDSPLPSGNAIAAIVLSDMGDHDAAKATITAFAGQLEVAAENMSAMLQAALLYQNEHGDIAIAAGPQAPAPRSPAQLASEILTVVPTWDGQTLTLRCRLAPDYHLNPHDAAVEPTHLTIPGADIASIHYPAGEPQDQFNITVIFKTLPREQFLLTLRYQPCTATACLPAISKTFEIAPPN